MQTFPKWVLRVRKIVLRFYYAQYLQFCAGDFTTPGLEIFFFYFIFLFQKKSLAVTLRIFPTLSSFYVHVTLAVECVVDYMLRCTSWGACPTQSSHQPSLLY